MKNFIPQSIVDKICDEKNARISELILENEKLEDEILVCKSENKNLHEKWLDAKNKSRGAIEAVQDAKIKEIESELKKRDTILDAEFVKSCNQAIKITEIEQQLAKNGEVNRWTPVTESLPSEKGLYLINFYDGVNTWFECCELCFTHSLVFFNNKLIKDGATHWMKTTEVK